MCDRRYYGAARGQKSAFTPLIDGGAAFPWPDRGPRPMEEINAILPRHDL
jgi:hypothetical protein